MEPTHSTGSLTPLVLLTSEVPLGKNHSAHLVRGEGTHGRLSRTLTKISVTPDSLYDCRPHPYLSPWYRYKCRDHCSSVFGGPWVSKSSQMLPMSSSIRVLPHLRHSWGSSTRPVFVQTTFSPTGY